MANAVGMFASAGLMYLSGNQWTVRMRSHAMHSDAALCHNILLHSTVSRVSLPPTQVQADSSDQISNDCKTVAATLYLSNHEIGTQVSSRLSPNALMQVEALGDVILIGMLLSVFSSCALFFFDDECTLGEESEAINHSASGVSLPQAFCVSRLPCDPAHSH